MGHILTYQKNFNAYISNLIHLSLAVELTYLIAVNFNHHTVGFMHTKNQHITSHAS
jgi:hypothetical protein